MPPSRPRLGSRELEALLAPFAIDRERYPVLVAGIRGTYRRTLGDPEENDRGIYDDALFLSSPSAMAAFNGNVDPSSYRPGHGEGAQKGMASLKPGTRASGTPSSRWPWIRRSGTTAPRGGAR